jgi:hypothetical protein
MILNLLQMTKIQELPTKELIKNLTHEIKDK